MLLVYVRETEGDDLIPLGASSGRTIAYLEFQREVPRVEKVLPKVYAVMDNEFRDYLRSLTTKEEFVVLDRVARCESGYNPLAYNPSGASGIMQFMPQTWKSWGVGDVFDPYANILAGVRLYRARGGKPWVCY